MILVTAETSRPMYQQVQKSIVIVAAAIIILSACFLMGVQLLLQRYILAPLSTLDKDIKVIGKTGNLSRRMPEKGDEEIVSMTRSLNEMLGVIEKQQDDLDKTGHELSTRNNELEEMVEEIQQQRDELDKARQELADRNGELEELLEEIQQQRDDLNETRQALADRNRDLEELNRKANLYLDIYLDVLTYEILNSIMGLRGYAELLGQTSGEKEKQLAEKITALAKKSDDVIRNIETISRIYKKPPRVYPIDLCEVMSRTRASWQGVTIHVGDCNRRVLANDMLGVVFDNIFANSLKYGGKNVAIDVDVKERAGGMIEIIVTDNGPGIPDTMKPQIFDRFARDTTVRSSYGLGLHIVKMLVESYKGNVWAGDRVEHDFTKGAAIHFTLPVTE
jgi:signal transduction histidine kinase